MSQRADVLGRLLALQRADGGFGPRAGRPGRTEETALAALALASDAHARDASGRARDWLASAQHEDGSWPLGSDVDEPSWASALAVLTLARAGGDRAQALRGARWLLAQEGRRAGWRVHLAQWLGAPRVVDQDPSLRGWPWVGGSSGWVEPTAYALLALKPLAPSLPRRAVARIGEGERLVYDRMCRGGGWNYGNSVVLDEALEPYPDTTAIALLALRDHADADANRRSLAVLERLVAGHDSGLALAWSILCLDAYGRDTRALRNRLEASFAARGFLDDVRSLALAALALGDGAELLGAPV